MLTCKQCRRAHLDYCKINHVESPFNCLWVTVHNPPLRIKENSECRVNVEEHPRNCSGKRSFHATPSFRMNREVIRNSQTDVISFGHFFLPNVVSVRTTLLPHHCHSSVGSFMSMQNCIRRSNTAEYSRNQGEPNEYPWKEKSQGLVNPWSWQKSYLDLLYSRLVIEGTKQRTAKRPNTIAIQSGKATTNRSINNVPELSPKPSCRKPFLFKKNTTLYLSSSNGRPPFSAHFSGILL